METDLKLYGNQLNYMQTCWTIGYVIGEIPSNIVGRNVRRLPDHHLTELSRS